MENLTLNFEEEKPEVMKLSELMEQVKVAFDTFIAFKNFVVECEIQSIKKVRSFYYFDLVEIGFDWMIKSKAKGNVFNPATVNAFLRRAKLSDIDEVLNKKVMLTVRPNFHKDYWFSLNIEKIHEGHFIWEQEINKAKILTKLESDGVLNLNKEKKVWFPEFKLAVITWEKSEWFRDFEEILKESGYNFEIDIFTSLVNRAWARDEVFDKLEEIENISWDYNLVVIVRWGWWADWMYWTNDEKLAFKIANFPLPVMSAVGHTVDLSILDIIAKYSAKTPSEWAQKIIDIYTEFEDNLNETYDDILWSLDDFRSYYRESLDRFALISDRYSEIFKGYKISLDNLDSKIDFLVKNKKREIREELENTYSKINLNSPEKVLNKWYALVFDDDKVEVDLKDWKDYLLKTKVWEFKVTKKD